MSKSNGETYILDTSALLTFIEDEDSSDVVNDLLIKAEEGEIRICLAFVSIAEVFYITLQERDEAEARRRVGLIQSIRNGVGGC